MSRKEHKETERRLSMPDFDSMMELAMNDPEAFEAERQEIISSFLDTVPDHNKRRLVGLQWKIDQVRDLAKTPMAACMAISNMMRDSLDELNFYQRELAKLDPVNPQHETELVQQPSPAKILPFTRH